MDIYKILCIALIGAILCFYLKSINSDFYLLILKEHQIQNVNDAHFLIKGDFFLHIQPLFLYLRRDLRRFRAR